MSTTKTATPRQRDLYCDDGRLRNDVNIIITCRLCNMYLREASRTAAEKFELRIPLPHFHSRVAQHWGYCLTLYLGLGFGWRGAIHWWGEAAHPAP